MGQTETTSARPIRPKPVSPLCLSRPHAPMTRAIVQQQSVAVYGSNAVEWIQQNSAGEEAMRRPLTTVGAAVALAGIALVSLHGRCAQAQDFSNKPIRIIVGLVAGGATDVTARLIAQKLTESLHTNVYVEN